MNAANNDLKQRTCTLSSEFNTPARKHVVRMATALNLVGLVGLRAQSPLLAPAAGVLPICSWRAIFGISQSAGAICGNPRNSGAIYGVFPKT